MVAGLNRSLQDCSQCRASREDVALKIGTQAQDPSQGAHMRAPVQQAVGGLQL